MICGKVGRHFSKFSIDESLMEQCSEKAWHTAPDAADYRCPLKKFLTASSGGGLSCNAMNSKCCTHIFGTRKTLGQRPQLEGRVER